MNAQRSSRVGAAVAVAHARALAVDAFELHLLDLELDLAAAREPRRDQILHDLLLAVNRERAPARELGERDAIAPLVEREQQPVVNQSLAVQALGQAQLVEQVDGALLEDAGAHALLHVGAAAAFEDHRRDPFALQQMREHQAGRAGPDDRDLSLGHLGFRHRSFHTHDKSTAPCTAGRN